MTLATWIAATLLGGCGATFRFLVDRFVSDRVDRDFPYGTFIVNVSGSCLLGLTVGLTLQGKEAVLIGSATIGAYTTFSTWMFETQRLVEDGEATGAAANVTASLAVGLLAAVLGRAIGAHL
jgi:fluoride exporter